MQRISDPGVFVCFREKKRNKRISPGTPFLFEGFFIIKNNNRRERIRYSFVFKKKRGTIEYFNQATASQPYPSPPQIQSQIWGGRRRETSGFIKRRGGNRACHLLLLFCCYERDSQGSLYKKYLNTVPFKLNKRRKVDRRLSESIIEQLYY